MAWPLSGLLANVMAKPIIESIIIPPFCHFLTLSPTFQEQNLSHCPTKRAEKEENRSGKMCYIFTLVYTTEILESEKKKNFPPIQNKILFFRR
jgi:hypothetical protein